MPPSVTNENLKNRMFHCFLCCNAALDKCWLTVSNLACNTSDIFGPTLDPGLEAQWYKTLYGCNLLGRPFHPSLVFVDKALEWSTWAPFWLDWWMILFIDLDLFLSENEDLNRNEIWKFNITITHEHRCRKTKNRLLKFCYVHATSAARNRLLFFLFLLCPFTVLMKQTSQAVCAIKQSIYS